MYCESSEMPELPSETYWRKFYPNFKVFTEQDVIPLRPKNFVDLFQLIRFPAAKSDIARIFLLLEYGGLYVDAHVGPASPSRLLMTLSRLAGCSVMLFGGKWMKTQIFLI
jgi:mannosyltransferase OCH1-like enzyme